MQFTMQAGFAVPFTVAPVDAAGNPSQATISNLSFASSDNLIFSVGANPGGSPGGTAVGIAAGTATLTGQATATEKDGTEHQISGAVTVVITAAPVPIPPAAALVFTFGTPAPIPNPPPVP